MDETNHKYFLISIKNRFIKEKSVKRSGYIISIIINLILLYIVNNILHWNLSFIAPTFNQVIWALNIAIGVSIFVNILFIIYNPKWFRYLMIVVVNIFRLIAVYTFYKVFPLVITHYYMVLYFKIVFIIIMVCLVIAIFFQIFKLLYEIIVINKRIV
jgi:hypothetical protein